MSLCYNYLSVYHNRDIIMPSVFLYSDPHFSHKGVCEFLRNDGVTKLRPWDNPDDMDEALVENFNNRVKVGDKCYFLGDVAINRRGLKVLERLECKNLVLIKGNHDIFKLNDYTEHFRDIRAYHVMNNMIFSHIPVHAESKGRFKANVHGHTHANRVMLNGKIDPWYYSACVENTDYKPILLEELIENIKAQGGLCE